MREARTALLAQAEGEDADDVILSWVQDARAASILTSAMKIPVPVKSGTPPIDSLFLWADTEVTPIKWRVMRYIRETK